MNTKPKKLQLDIKRILVIYLVDGSDPNNGGVWNKFIDQQQAFNNLGYKVDGIAMYDGNIVDGENQIIFEKVKNLFSWQKHKFFFSRLNKRLHACPSYDLIYIRYPFSSRYFIQFLSNVKSWYPDIRIALELPTFPYKQEFKGAHKLKFWYDTYWQKRLKLFVDRVVCIGKGQHIFGIPTINISNGINVNDVKFYEKTKSDFIRLTAIGRWRKWYGLDRLIVGLGVFRNQHDDFPFRLSVIGEGPDLKYLKKLVIEQKLNDYVSFEGAVRHEHLEKYFSNTDIGVGTLGGHRKDLEQLSSIKHRTFGIAGIPFFLSTEDADFPEDLNFVLYFPPDETPIEVEKIIEFYKKTTKEKMNIIEYTKENCGWEKKLDYVLKDLRGL